MLLAVDIGNTNIVAALHDGNTWIAQKRIRTKSPHAVIDFSALVRKLSFDKAVVSSVVPMLTNNIVYEIMQVGGFMPVIVDKKVETGLVKESIPIELGSDILCNLAEAHRLYPNDYVTVADFGTAFTTETISPSGEVLGVTIGPGMMTSVKALFQNTAQLPEIRLDLPTTVLGRNTIESIRAGVLYGFTGQFTAIIAQIEKELGHKVKVIATGGFSRYITGYVQVDRADVAHTINGAKYICELNS